MCQSFLILGDYRTRAAVIEDYAEMGWRVLWPISSKGL